LSLYKGKEDEDTLTKIIDDAMAALHEEMKRVKTTSVHPFTGAPGARKLLQRQPGFIKNCASDALINFRHHY
jgi:hypothetical protein